MAKFQIVGVFWQQMWKEFPNFRRLEAFAGVMNIDENGSFYGETEDDYGKADVTGEMAGALLEFRKKYRDDRKGAVKEEIRYFLQGTSFSAFRANLCGGWKGSYIYIKNGEKFDGQAACSIHPLE